MTCKRMNITNNWYTSFGDFLTLILCFFLVIISNSFKNSSFKDVNIDNQTQISYSVKNDDLTFILPSSLENKFKILKLNDTYLNDNEKTQQSYLIKLQNEFYVNNIEEFKNLLKNLAITQKYGFKLIGFKNFKDFNEFLGLKRQFSDANIDVSEFKMSHNDENEIILRVYEKI